MKLVKRICMTIALAFCLPAAAECPLDHFIIGCNRDGVEGTPDDRILFVDSWQKYRDSDETPYANWFYPLHKSIFTSYSYRIGEPGFDAFQAVKPSATYTYDPNRSLAGDPDLDYCVTVECLALSDGLRAVHKDYPQFTIDAVGQTFDHSYIHYLRGDSHIHMSYQATGGESLHWITFRVFDSLEDGDRYEPSDPFTIVFNVEPPAGDLVVNGLVDIADLAELSHSWLSPESSRHSDFCERADTNRDGVVNLRDFARMAANWSD
ncbi:MAG: dockerin type I domain-containing protein [Phycisphaerales bacterium]